MLETQLNAATQAAAYEASKDEDLLATIQGVISARMPQGGLAPPELRDKVSELAAMFDSLQQQHVASQASVASAGVGPPAVAAPSGVFNDGFPADGESPDDGQASQAPAPIPGQHVPTPADDKELETVAEAQAMDTSEGRRRAAAA
eukprot:1088574-Pyramimonas_sp.AAC.1